MHTPFCYQHVGYIVFVFIDVITQKSRHLAKIIIFCYLQHWCANFSRTSLARL